MKKLKIVSRNQRDKNKKFKQSYKIIFFVLAAAIILSGCSRNNPVSSNSSPATVQGRISGSSVSKISQTGSTTTGVQNANVILAEVRSDGSLETVSNSTVKTDANGHFTIETNLDGVSNLVVVATKDTTQWKAIVSSEVKSGQTVYSEPLDNVSKAEAEVYLKATANQYNDVSVSQIASYVNANVASEILADQNTALQIASVLNIEAKAESDAATSSIINISAAQWNSVVNSQTEANSELETELYNSSSSSEDDNAYENFYQNSASAFVKAGVSINAYCKILQIAHKELLKSSGNLNSQTAFSLNQSAALIRAKFFGYAVHNQFASMDAEDSQVQSADSESASLSASVESAVNLSEIDSAFTNYSSKIIDDLKSVFSSNVAALISITTSAAAFKSQLDASISSSSKTGDLINAYGKFYSDVQAAASSIISQNGNDQLKTAIDLMVLLMAGS